MALEIRLDHLPGAAAEVRVGEVSPSIGYNHVPYGGMALIYDWWVVPTQSAAGQSLLRAVLSASKRDGLLRSSGS